jgi:regulator of protease activity HflC (stomatin/prohibitin superfamily)
MSDTTLSSGFKPIVKITRLFVIVVGLAILFQSCTLTTVRPGYVGVRYNNVAGLLEEDLGPGWHWEIAGLQKVWRLPGRYLFLNYIDEQRISIRTKDNNTVSVDVSIPYRIKPGEAWRVMEAGNQVRDTNGAYRFERFAQDTATDVLRSTLANLKSEDFYDTDRRLEVAQATLELLNKKLGEYHLEASTVLVRASYFRDEYEQQLAKIQYNEQQKLLDHAKEQVAQQQQTFDNYKNETDALVAAKQQEWAQKLAELDRAFQVGFIDTAADQTPGAARRALMAMPEPKKVALKKTAATVLTLPEESIKDEHLLGIKPIEAETTEYGRRVKAEADGVSARLTAEADAMVAKVQANYEQRVNALLGSPAGRAYVAYQAANNIQFADKLTFQAGDGIPSVLRLRAWAQSYMNEAR